MKDRSEFLDPQALADYAMVPVTTVYAWNHKGTGPRFAKIGRHVRYRKVDVDRWIEAQYDRKPVAR